MPRYKAIPDSQGGGIEDDNGWSDFRATKEYRDNFDAIDWTKKRKKNEAKALQSKEEEEVCECRVDDYLNLEEEDNECFECGKPIKED